MTDRRTEHEPRIADAQWWEERKRRQLNDGPCAAMIVDCDCDQCLAVEAKTAFDLRRNK